MWKDRPTPILPTIKDLAENNSEGIEENEGILLSDHEEDSIKNDVITAMLSLHQVVDV